MPQSKNVLFISTNLDWGGSEVLWAAAAFRALEYGHNVDVLVNPRLLGASVIYNLESAGAKIHLLFSAEHKHASFLERVANRLSRETPNRAKSLSPLPQQSFDCICINQGTWDDALWQPGLCEAILGLQVPYVCLSRSDSSRGALSINQRELGRKFYANASYLIPASRSTIEVSEIGLACHLANGIILHSPIRRTESEMAKLDDNKTIVIGCIGRITCANKGQHHLLTALSGPVWKNRNWVLHFYGTGPDQPYLEELIAYLDLSDRVRWMGHEENLDTIMSVCNIFAQPSIVEGMPQSVLEAMACAKPVVATEIGGIPDWIVDGITGFIAPSPSPRHLHEALDRAWNRMADWHAIGLRAKEKIDTTEDSDPATTLFALINRSMDRRTSASSK